MQLCNNNSSHLKELLNLSLSLSVYCQKNYHTYIEKVFKNISVTAVSKFIEIFNEDFYMMLDCLQKRATFVDV